MQEEDPNLFIRNILNEFQQDQVQTTRHILQKIESNNQDSLKLLKTLNLLLNSKALPSRQRRDVAAIARLVADSNILNALQEYIQNEIICRVDGFFLETIKLIGSICWQNPHFIDNILTSSHTVIDLLLIMLKDERNVAPNDQALINIINFMHSISLKQGPIRDEKLAEVFTTFIQNIFTKDKFFECLQSKKLSSLFSAIQKFFANVKNVDKYTYNALIRSIIEVNQAYKRIQSQFQYKGSDANAVIEARKAIKFNDRKLIALLKLEQKSRASLFQQIDPFRFVVYLKIIMKIAVNRRYVLVETAYENKILVSSIVQIIKVIKDWKEHLNQNHMQKEQEGKEEKQKTQQKLFSLQSQMVDESKQTIKEGNYSEITNEYFLNTKDQKTKFDLITGAISTFSQKPNKMIIQAINAIIQANQKLQALGQSNPQQDMFNYFIFKIQQEGSRLDRILTIAMKIMEEKQLMKKDYYKIIVTKLSEVYPIFTRKGLLSQIKTVSGLLPELNNMTTQSDLSCNRFIFRKIDEDHFKSNLHLKITATPNSYNLISDTILRFSLHLSEYKEFLQHCITQFLHKTLEYYQNNYLIQMKQKQKLQLEDIEMLRSIVRTLSQLFPNNHRSNKDEVVRLKLYYYCMLLRKNNYSVDIFSLSSEVINLLDKHNPSSTEELEDNSKNRWQICKTIFYKLITHRMKLFFSVTTNFYQDLRKISTPRNAHSPIGPIQIERDFMFTGNHAYVQCMETFLKRIIVQKGKNTQNALKEEIVGLVLTKMYDFRNFDVYDQDPEIQNREKQYRQDQVRKYNFFIDQKCQNLLNWIIENAGYVIYKLPMLVKKMLHFQKEEYIFQSLKRSENQIQIQYATRCFSKVSQMINQSHYLIQGCYLDLGIKAHKRKRQQSQINEQIDLRNEVIKLANCCIIVSEFMSEYNASGLAQKCINTIPENYITSLISFSRLYIKKFAAELYFPQEANYLIKTTLWMIENYLAYKSILVEEKQKRQKKKRKQAKMRRKIIVSKKKETIKKSKAKKKNKYAKENRFSDRNQSNNLESNVSKNFSENGKSKQVKRNRKRKLKEKQSNELKRLYQSQQNIENQKQKKTKKKRDFSYFQGIVQDFIKVILALSNLLNEGQSPFLKNTTLQYIIKFISSNVKKNVLSKPPFKCFQLKISNFISDLLRVELAEKKILGYQLLLSRIGLKLINQEHMRIDFQTGIKRFFYDHSNQRIAYVEFMNFLQTNFQKAPNLSHILQIIYTQPGAENSNSIPFTYQNTQGIEQTGKSKLCSVRIKQNVELNMISVNNKSEKKINNAKQQEKKDKAIKLSDYVPEGEIYLYIYEMISYAIQKIILEINNSMDYTRRINQIPQYQTSISQTIDAFNIKIVINALQFLIRESPTLAPWIAKFKCKKIILSSLKNQNILNKQKLTKFVFSLLNNYDQQAQSITEIGFLQILLRLFSPFLLNSISGIILQLCFDSTPLVHNSKNINQSEQQKQKYISFGSVVRQKVVSELDSILFRGNPLDHIFRKAAAFNTLSVLINIKQMAKLLIECNFIAKIYNEYLKIVKQYANDSQNFMMPVSYIYKIYIPFFLQTLSILQQLNIAFHHNKKLIKNQQKTMLNSLILSQQSINSQLIPIDVFKKTKFKSQWPLGKEHQKKQNRHGQRFAANQSDQDSFFRENEEQDSYTDQSQDSQDEQSMQSDMLEERFAELERIDQQDSYMSLQQGNHSHLLSDQWDYSNSHQSQLEDQQRMMQQEMRRQLIQNELQDQGLEQDPNNYEIDQMQELSEGQMEQIQEEGNSINDQSLEENQSDSLQEDSAFISSFMSIDQEDEIHQCAFSPKEQLLFKHKEQQEFYESASDIINFEKINFVPRISKIEVIQIMNLRFFLQIFSYPERQFQNALSKRVISTPQIYEQKKVQENKELLRAFSKDQQLKLSHWVQWNQIYRYEHLLKKHPLCESVLSKIFTDQYQSGVSRMRRRNAVIHRNGLIQIFSGPFNAERQGYIAHPLPAPRLEYSEAESQSHLDPPVSENNDEIRLVEGHEIREEIQIQSQSQHNSESQLDEQQEQQMPQEIIPLREEDDLNRQAIQLILRELNMNMTSQEFNMLSTDIQNDIIQNYYMVNDERALHNVHREIHNLPIQQPERVQDNQLLRNARVRQVDMSPRLAGQALRIQQVESLNGSQQQNEVIEGVQEQYRKMSMQHAMKVNKDIIQTINKNGKNNNKFYQIQDEQFQKIINLVFELSQKEFRNYPYSLIQTCCINTVNLDKIISTLIALLYLYSDETQQQLEEKNSSKYFYSLKVKLQETDKEAVKPKLTLKILYLLSHLTKNYSIAMSFLKINQEVPKKLEGCLSQAQKQRTSLQMLIMLLNQSQILKNGQLLQFLLSVIENVTVNHFYKIINNLVQSKKDGNKVQDQNIKQPIKITDQATRILCNLLQNKYAKDYLHSLSRIIMRLSLNQSNLSLFIKYMYFIVEQLSTTCLSEMQKIVTSKQQQSEVNSQKEYLKIVNLMNIFFEMVISFKTYPTTPEKHESFLKDLRKIVEMEILQVICQKAASYLFQSQNQKIQMIMGEILEIYFILYEIAIATSDFSQEIKPEDLNHKHIAGLGQIKELRKLQKSNQLKKEQDLILGKFNLSKLWKQSISQPVFKTYMNNCIKKKLSSLNQQTNNANQSIFDVPIFKVPISTPHMLSFDNKRLIFKNQLKRLRKKQKYHIIHMSLRREQVFQDSFTEIMQYDSQILKGKIKIEFRQEQGEDAGGITRQWFQLLSKKMFDPNYALFKSGSTGNTFHPSPQSYINNLHLKYFKFIGRIIGKALYDGYLLDAYFTPAFYKHLLNLPITYLDMEQQDYEYFKSLKWILDNSPIQDFLQLNFTYSFDNFGQIQTKELIPRGTDILVTEQNKLQYVQLSSYAKMATSIKHQLEALLQGFHELIPHKLIKVFNEKELEIMISGRPSIDIEDLRRNSELVNYLKNDQIITWLFQVLESFDMELRTAFLQFVTGSSRVPVEGFKDLRGMNGVQKFNIHKQFQEQRLPRAHTCFNQLDLPNYKTKDILIEKLMLAITEGKEGFHMI